MEDFSNIQGNALKCGIAIQYEAKKFADNLLPTQINITLYNCKVENCGKIIGRRFRMNVHNTGWMPQPVCRYDKEINRFR